MDDVARWLDSLRLGEYAELFRRNAIDLDAVTELDEQDLRELDIPMGHRKKLLRAIEEMRERPAAPVPAPVPNTTPAHLSEQILASRAVLEGERKQVSVLFADIKGSTELISDMDAEAAAEVLRRAITEMMAAVHQYDGTVNKVLGDGIMAIFGAPIAHEDHAVRACYAALAMQERLGRLAPETRQQYGVELQVRQGINSGDVVVRAINNDLTMDYDAVGPTVHLAGRMEQMAPAGGCRLTLNTNRLADGYIVADSLGAVPVRGVDAPVEVFDLRGAVDFRSRFLAGQRGRLTRFIGRDDEMAALVRAFEAARRGEGRSVSVMGEAGVGKSRLFYEFVHGPTLREALVLESGSVSHARAAAFHPLIDLLRSYFGIGRGDDERRVREKVSGKLVTLSESLLAIATPILALLGATPDDPAWGAREPAQRRQATLDACRTLLLREAKVQPLAVVFEDLHWIDAETQDFLDLLMESLADAPVLLLFNYRPEYVDKWVGRDRHTQIRVDPLPRAGGEEMLTDLLGDGAELAELRRLLMERTEGHPFYIEETVQGLADSEVLVGTRGSYALAVPVQQISVPPTVQSVIGARIDRLPPDTKRLLQTAAVIGKDFELSLLRDISEMDEAAVLDHLATLQAGEFVYQTQLFPDAEYTFKHALTHQVAYEGLLRDHRRDMHARVLAALERLYEDRSQDHMERLVYHGRRGERWESVHRHGMAAGDRALAMSANRSAVEAFQAAVEALGRLPETPERLRDAIDCRLMLRDALFVLGGSERSPVLLQEARELAAKLGDQQRLVETILYQSGNDWQFGRYGAAIERAREGYHLATRTGDDSLVGLARYRMTTAALLSGDYATAAETGVAGAEVLRPVADTLMRFGGYVQSFVGSFGAIALAELGRFEEAIDLGREAYQKALALDHAYSITVGCFGIGHALALRGEFEAALGPLEEGLRQIDFHGVAATVPWVAGRAAYVFAVLGRMDDMDAAIELAANAPAIQFSRSMIHPFWHLWTARAYLAAGRVGDARRHAASAIAQDGAPEVDPGVRAWAEWAKVECALRDGETNGGLRDTLDRVASFADRQGMRPLRAHCLFSRARLAHNATMAAKACALAESMGMARLGAEIGGLSP